MKLYGVTKQDIRCLSQRDQIAHKYKDRRKTERQKAKKKLIEEAQNGYTNFT